MSERKKFLHLEPRQDWATIVADTLVQAGADLTLLHEKTAEAALETIQTQGHELAGVLTSYRNTRGGEVVEAARSAGVPKIAVLTGDPTSVENDGIEATTFDKGYFNSGVFVDFFLERTTD